MTNNNMQYFMKYCLTTRCKKPYYEGVKKR